MQHGYPFHAPCDVYELISRTLDLQFVDIPSLEGMYLEEAEAKRICVCAHRPVGRQKFTTAHELGHHLLGHGTQIDAGFEIDKVVPDYIEEQAADVFARYLLMPPRAVHAGFRNRGLSPLTDDPRSFYCVSSWLGVGYTTLVQHMTCTLNLLSKTRSDMLQNTAVKELKTSLVGVSTTNDVWQLDDLWDGFVVHAQLGDFLLGLSDVEQQCGTLSRFRDDTWVATAVGSGTYALRNGGSIKVCVSKRDFAGFYEYRYMPE